MTPRIGYDVERAVELRTRTRSALDELHVIARAGHVAHDPLAAELLAACRRMRTVLEAQWLPTLDAIVNRDPLGHAHRELTLPSLVHRLLAWTSFVPNQAIFAAIARLGTPDGFPADGDDRSHRLDIAALLGDHRFAALAQELSDRVASGTIPHELIVELLPSTPLLGLVAAVAPYPPTLTVRLLDAGLSTTSHVDDHATRLDAAAVDALLSSLTSSDVGSPEVVLDVLNAHNVRELLTWPFLDPSVVGDVLLTGLVASAHDPALLAGSHDVLRHLVDVANDPYVDRATIPGPIARAVAAGTAAQFPSFVTSLEPGDQVNLKDAEGYNFGPPLGDYEPVIDFLGMLLRDADAATTLVAALQPLAATAVAGTTHIDLADVGDLAIALANAAANERVEDRLHDAAVRSLVEDVTVAVGVAVGLGAVALHFGPAARSLVSQVVRRSGGHIADRIGDQSGDERRHQIDTAAAAEVMIEIGVYEAFLDDPDRFVVDSGAPSDPDALAAARRSMERVRQLAADGVGLTEIERALQDVHLDIVRAGGAHLVEPFDDGAIASLDVHATSEADLDRPLD